MGLEGGHPDCLPISIPHSDPFFSLHGRSCMNFARVVPGLKQGCGLGPREQFNTISSVIDANTVYSSDPALQRQLRSPLPVLSTLSTIYNLPVFRRTFEGGRLKTLPIFSEYGLKDMLPLKLEEPDDGCLRPSRAATCHVPRAR